MRRGFLSIALVTIAAGTILGHARLSRAGGDLLAGDDTPSEFKTPGVPNDLATANCGQTALTMTFKYYFHTRQMAQPTDLSDFVIRDTPYTPWKGTYPTDIAAGAEKIADDPKVGFGAHISAQVDWETKSDWRSLVEGEIGAGHPVIAFVEDWLRLWPNRTGKHYGHWTVVSAISGDSVTYHDPVDGGPHTVSISTFEGYLSSAWVAKAPDLKATQAFVTIHPDGLPLPSPSPSPSPSLAHPSASPPPSTTANSSSRPGGLWVTAPANNSSINATAITLEARAYPSSQSGAPIDHVDFTYWSPFFGDVNQPWRTACRQTVPTFDDHYFCTIDISAVLAGEVRVSFDVYDRTGGVNLAPNGVRVFQKLNGTNSGSSPSPSPQPSQPPFGCVGLGTTSCNTPPPGASAPAPTDVRTSCSSGVAFFYVVSWSESGSATGFKVYQRGLDNSVSLVTHTGPSDRSYGPLPGGDHVFGVSAVSGTSESSITWSSGLDDSCNAPPSPSPRPTTPSPPVTVSITTDRTTYAIGDSGTYCYTVSQAGHVRVTDIRSDGTSHVLIDGVDDGTGDCRQGTIDGPTGSEILRIEFIGANGAVLATNEVIVVVTASGGGSGQTITCYARGSAGPTGTPDGIATDPSCTAAPGFLVRIRGLQFVVDQVQPPFPGQPVEIIYVNPNLPFEPNDAETFTVGPK